MASVTKNFRADLSLGEFKEVEAAVKKENCSRREWLLKNARAKKSETESATSVESLQKITKKLQEEINVAYQEISDVCLDVGAELLKTDRKKAVELLSKALSLKAPILNLDLAEE